MKYIKLLLLLAVAPFIASCSDDDDINSANTTVGFESETVVVKENSGYFNVPIAVEGARNGSVQVTVTAEPVGESPAIEEEHYRITDKTLNLYADTLKSATMNVQIQAIDNPEINENRSFKLIITSANGAEITTSTTTVTIRDNDAAFYEKFFGKWTMSGIMETSSGRGTFKKDVTITGVSDENNPDYDNILYVSAPSFINVGVSLDLTWRMRYTFDMTAKTGTIGVICGEEIASYGTSYSWMWLGDDGTYLTDDDVTAPWALGEGDTFPGTITFDPDKTLHMYCDGTWANVYGIKLEKK